MSKKKKKKVNWPLRIFGIFFMLLMVASPIIAIISAAIE